MFKRDFAAKFVDHFERQSHFIYKFLCSNWNHSYYHKIGHHIKVRYGKRWSISAIKKISNKKQSVLKNHGFFEDSVGSFEDFLYVRYESIKFEILTKEHDTT